MAQIIFNIGSAKLQRVIDGMLEVFPNIETIDDPTWIDPKDGSTAPQIAKYTDNQWLKERIRRFMVSTVKRGEEIKAQRTAKDNLQETDTLVS